MSTMQLIHLHSEIIHELVRRFKAINPRVFGSVANATDTPSSDIDILVDPLPETTLFDLGALQQELELALNRRIDLLTPNDLPEKFRQEVLQMAVAI